VYFLILILILQAAVRTPILLATTVRRELKTFLCRSRISDHEVKFSSVYCRLIFNIPDASIVVIV